MYEQYLVISCTLVFNNVSIRTFALVDTSATCFAFVDKDFVRIHSLPTKKLNEPLHIEVIDGRPIHSGTVTHLARLGLNIYGHEEEALFFITSVAHFPLVLGLPWMKLHDVAMCFASYSITFGSDYYLSHYYPQTSPPNRD